MAWAALFGTVSFEVFGQLHGIVGEQPGDRGAFSAESVRRWAEQVGISSGRIDTAPDGRHLKPAGGGGQGRQCPGHPRQHQSHKRSGPMNSAPSRTSQSSQGFWLGWGVGGWGGNRAAIIASAMKMPYSCGGQRRLTTSSS